MILKMLISSGKDESQRREKYLEQLPEGLSGCVAHY
jgi:hypothetical protein